MTDFNLDGPQLPPLTMRAGQDATFAGTFPPEIVDWSTFSFRVLMRRATTPVEASVDLGNLAGDDKQVVWSYSTAQTLAFNPGKRGNAAGDFVIWSKDPNGLDVPLGHGVVVVKSEDE